MPVSKRTSQAVIGIGGAVNQSGMLLIEATVVGEISTLQQIVRMVEQAQTSKVPRQSINSTGAHLANGRPHRGHLRAVGRMPLAPHAPRVDDRRLCHRRTRHG